jgi:hypothetical protein
VPSCDRGTSSTAARALQRSASNAASRRSRASAALLHDLDAQHAAGLLQPRCRDSRRLEQRRQSAARLEERANVAVHRPDFLRALAPQVRLAALGEARADVDLGLHVAGRILHRARALQRDADRLRRVDAVARGLRRPRA